MPAGRDEMTASMLAAAVQEASERIARLSEITTRLAELRTRLRETQEAALLAAAIATRNGHAQRTCGKTIN